MNTKAFGQPLWQSMFMIAMNYPEKLDTSNKDHILLAKRYKRWFMSFKFMLPCKHCRESYCLLTRNVPINLYLGSRKDLVFWLYTIKDLVNKKLKVQEFIAKGKSVPENFTSSPPFEKVYAHYDSFRANGKKNLKKY